MRVLAALLACCLASGAASSQAQPDAFAIVGKLDVLAESRLWPGFDIRTVPLAIYDGTTTYLFRHPSPPAEFQPVAGREGVLAAPGQHPSVRANTSVDIGAALTATYIFPRDGGASLEAAAAVVAHEAFHVYQRRHHPGWVTNEGELFTYPVDDERNLLGRKLEALAWERAVNAADVEEAACWADEALRVRSERFGRIPPGAAAYERGVELVEGTAFLVQLRAGDPGEGTIRPENVRATNVRRAAYGVGRAMGQLLDRLAPGWERRLEAEKAAALDASLESALRAARPGERRGGCGPDAATREKAAREASAEVAGVRADRERQRDAFEKAPGWMVRIVAGETPLLPQGFDPMNVTPLGGLDVLHTRWSKLGNGHGSVEALNRAALTRGVGPHPLFQGVSEVRVTGLAERPQVSEDGDAVTIEARGLSARFRQAEVEAGEREIVVRLSKQAGR